MCKQETKDIRYYVQDPGYDALGDGEPFENVWDAIEFAKTVKDEWEEIQLVDFETGDCIRLK